MLEGVNEVVIIDNGAYHIRIASVPYPPKSSPPSPSSVDIGVYPNFIARTRSSSSRKTYISSQILTDLNEYGGLVLRQPHQKGMISDWAAQKLIWDHVFASHFAQPAPKRWLENKAVIITESYFGLDEVRNATDLMLFEQYGAQALWRCDTASLSAWTDLFHTGSIRGKQAESASAFSKDQDLDHLNSEPTPAKRSRQSRASVASSRPQVPFETRDESALSTSSALVQRPDVFLVLDLGYSACHAVPVVKGSIQYAHTKRLDVGGKILTNLLKETLSFRQLDMMDEFWLVEHIRRRTSFVAADNDVSRARHLKPERVISDLLKEAQIDATAPCDWTFDQLLTLCKHRRRASSNEALLPDVSIQWKLPDYSTDSSGVTAAKEDIIKQRSNHSEEARKYGAIVSGPSLESQSDWLESQGKVHDDTERKFEAACIVHCPAAPYNGPKVVKSNVIAEDDEGDDDPQYLTLSNERFAVSEVLFAPSMIGLAQNGIPELAAEAIASFVQSRSGNAAASSELMWANILLVGGLANIPGLKRRLYHKLLSLAPCDISSINVRRETPTAQSQFADLTAIKAAILLATAPPSTTEHDWLHTKWLSNIEWTQSSSPAALAKQRFGRP